MSAAPTIRATQFCLRSALADEVTAVGGIGAAAAEVGASEDTLRRWISGTHGDWSAAAIGALHAFEQVVGIFHHEPADDSGHIRRDFRSPAGDFHRGFTMNHNQLGTQGSRLRCY